MARYYKYKTPDDVTADAARLGYQLSLSGDFSVLFEPIAIGTHKAGNRLAVQPMEGCDGTLDGRPDELTYRRYRRFGAGGAKIIWAEATAIAEKCRMNPRQLWINEQTVSALQQMLAGCRAAHREQFGSDDDLVVGLQLTHSGRFSYRRPLLATRDPILDPLTVDKSTGKVIDESYPLLSDDDLKRIEDDYAPATLAVSGPAARSASQSANAPTCLPECRRSGRKWSAHGSDIVDSDRHAPHHQTVIRRFREEEPIVERPLVSIQCISWNEKPRRIPIAAVSFNPLLSDMPGRHLTFESQHGHVGKKPKRFGRIEASK